MKIQQRYAFNPTPFEKSTFDLIKGSYETYHNPFDAIEGILDAQLKLIIILIEKSGISDKELLEVLGYEHEHEYEVVE